MQKQDVIDFLYDAAAYFEKKGDAHQREWGFGNGAMSAYQSRDACVAAARVLLLSYHPELDAAAAVLEQQRAGAVTHTQQGDNV